MPAGEMDPVYSIGVNNRYDMIDSDMIEDPLELIRAAQEKPKKEKDPKSKARKDVKTTKPIEKKTVKIETPAENESDNKRNDRPRSDRGRGGGRGRGGRGRGGDGRGRGGERRGRGGSRGGFSPNSPNNQDGFGFDNNNQGGFGNYQTQTDVSDGFGSGFGGDSEERRGGRSGYRGSRGGRGGGRGRGRGGHREFDRRSGSDKSSVKAVDKRDGSGSYNWGTPQDEINAASEEHSVGFGTPKETEDVPTETTENPETEETPEVVDVGPQEITFEEYKKQLSGSRQKPEFNLRKVEGDKKSKQLKKPTEKDNESTSAFFFPKKNVQETYKTSGRIRENLNVDIRYGSGENRHLDGSRRGGRGGRGRRGGGGRRDDGAKGTAIALTNDEEFPSL